MLIVCLNMTERKFIASKVLDEVIGVLSDQRVIERVVRIDVSADRCLVEMKPLAIDSEGTVIDVKGEPERVTARGNALRRDLPGASLPRDL